MLVFGRIVLKEYGIFRKRYAVSLLFSPYAVLRISSIISSSRFSSGMLIIPTAAK